MTDIDAGATAPIDAPAPEVDAGVLAPKTMTVQLAASNVTAFEIWEDGKKILDGPDAIEVPEGATRTIVIKARGFKDKTVVVDTKQRKLKITLSKVPGGGRHAAADPRMRERDPRAEEQGLHCPVLPQSRQRHPV